jgi:GNAT superfamily N-acetyltransferase
VIFVALSEAAERGELLLVPGGMCRFHCRKDGTITIREILVLPGCRKHGIGRGLIRQIVATHPGVLLRARCPTGYEANHFWARLGFELAEEKVGVNLWVYRA